MGLLREVVTSFHYDKKGFGLPLGNLASQLFANVYMNELDQFIKHKLKIKYYIRYADDFVILSEDKTCLKGQLALIGDFLQNKLSLTIHPDKIYIKTLYSGVNFLGWVNFFDHRVIKRRTKDIMFERLKENSNPVTLSSYFGLLKHGNTQKVKNEVLKIYIENYD
ncbi:MAG: RNA-directed DNA polymerase [Parcubacteria group bacterium Licking1014_1]|nr:MAG: RNA-directed DNA polymerase [Parcubacteria group bacterium Licking1014_1]